MNRSGLWKKKTASRECNVRSTPHSADSTTVWEKSNQRQSQFYRHIRLICLRKLGIHVFRCIHLSSCSRSVELTRILSFLQYYSRRLIVTATIVSVCGRLSCAVGMTWSFLVQRKGRILCSLASEELFSMSLLILHSKCHFISPIIVNNHSILCFETF